MTGDLNAYFCDECGGYIVTIDRDRGVTPMFLACRVQGKPGPDNDCHGRMSSMMYPELPWPEKDGHGNLIPTVPTWEWYRPVGQEMKRLKKKARQRGGEHLATLDHVEQGGLLLRRIEDA